MNLLFFVCGRFEEVSAHKSYFHVCRPVRMDAPMFQSVDFIPDPTPGEEGHYQGFADLYHRVTTEEHRPSIKPVKKKLPFSPNVQHAKNTGLMLQCSECEKWRLLFTKFKLKPAQKAKKSSVLDDVEYTCGATLGKAQLFVLVQPHI